MSLTLFINNIIWVKGEKSDYWGEENKVKRHLMNFYHALETFSRGSLIVSLLIIILFRD